MRKLHFLVSHAASNELLRHNYRAATILPRVEIRKGVERVNLFPGGQGALDVGGLFHGSTVSPVFRQTAQSVESGIKIFMSLSSGSSVRWSFTGKTAKRLTRLT